MTRAADIDAIDAWLPQTQCAQCGYPDCRAYARAIVEHAANINQCPPGGDQTIRGLAALLGVERKPLDPAFGVHRPRPIAVIDENRCIGCTLCIQACPVDAIVGAAKQMHTVIAPECTGCELCVPPCPVDCIDLPPAPDVAPGDDWRWPDYSPADTERARRRAAARRLRLAAHQVQRDPHHKTRRQAPLPERQQIRREIQAAVARVRARRGKSRTERS
jgi:electron transport complex protein RnfB